MSGFAHLLIVHVRIVNVSQRHKCLLDRLRWCPSQAIVWSAGFVICTCYICFRNKYLRQIPLWPFSLSPQFFFFFIRKNIKYCRVVSNKHVIFSEILPYFAHIRIGFPTMLVENRCISANCEWILLFWAVFGSWRTIVFLQKIVNSTAVCNLSELQAKYFNENYHIMRP